jgi:hypothetical protein
VTFPSAHVAVSTAAAIIVGTVSLPAGVAMGVVATGVAAGAVTAVPASAVTVANTTPTASTAEPVETVLSTRPAQPMASAVRGGAANTAPGQLPAMGGNAGSPGNAGPIVVLPPQAGEEPLPAGPRERPRIRTAERQRDNDDDPAPRRRAAPRDPSDRCADRNFLMRPMCMKHECDTDPRLRHHPECVHMQQAEQERRDVLNR